MAISSIGNGLSQPTAIAYGLSVYPRIAGSASGLWAPERRGLTTGLVLSTTFVAAEALAVITIMPRVAADLGGLDLYGWVFSAFMLGSLLHQSGDFDGAVDAYQRAIDFDHPVFTPQAAYNLGLVHTARGDKAAARAAFLIVVSSRDAEAAAAAKRKLDAL